MLREMDEMTQSMAAKRRWAGGGGALKMTREVRERGFKMVFMFVIFLTFLFPLFAFKNLWIKLH